MIRRALFLLLGMLLGGFAVVALAASTAPTGYNTMGGTTGHCDWNQTQIAGTGSTAQASCEASKSVAQQGTGSCSVPGTVTAANANAAGTSCTYTCGNIYGNNCSWSTSIVPICPTGSTYNATTKMCDGAAAADCPAYGTAYSSGYYLMSKMTGSGAACTSSKCSVQFSGDCPAGKDAAGNLYCKGEYAYLGGKEGDCTAATEAVAASTATPSPTTTSPPCAEGEGVVTSTSGKVACVPPGTPNAEEPKTGEKTSTETKSDGSTVTVTTSSTCTGAGACSSTTTTTVTGAGGGTTAGQAGTPGTTTKKTETKGDATTDEDGCDPTKQMCSSPETEGLYTKKDKEIKGPIQTFADGVKTSALGTATDGFFSVSVPAGSCPQWSASVDYLNVTINVSDYFCNSTATAMMDVIGTVLMAVAAFAAFRWAIL